MQNTTKRLAIAMSLALLFPVGCASSRSCGPGGCSGGSCPSGACHAAAPSATSAYPPVSYGAPASMGSGTR